MRGLQGGVSSLTAQMRNKLQEGAWILNSVTFSFFRKQVRMKIAKRQIR